LRYLNISDKYLSIYVWIFDINISDFCASSIFYSAKRLRLNLIIWSKNPLGCLLDVLDNSDYLTRLIKSGKNVELKVAATLENMNMLVWPQSTEKLYDRNLSKLFNLI